MRAGDFLVTSGEVFIKRFAVEGSTVTAEVEWTFPLGFVELVWGDGHKTGRQVISTTDRPPFASVRFAAWDSAGNGRSPSRRTWA